jgi:hypothetical protein
MLGDLVATQPGAHLGARSATGTPVGSSGRPGPVSSGATVIGDHDRLADSAAPLLR